MAQLLFFLAGSLLLRAGRFSWLGWFQDLSLGLPLFGLFPPLGMFFNLYLLLDAFLFKALHLRMRWAYLGHLRHPSSLYSSAKVLGLPQFLFLSGGLVVGSCAVSWVPFEPGWGYWLVTVGVVVGACVGKGYVSQDQIYRIYNPFWLEGLSRRSISQEPLLFSTSQGPRKVTVETGDSPHVVFLFLESFGARDVGPEVTPRFSQLSQEGIYFPQFYSNGTLTYRALLAGLFGLPPGSTSEGLAPYLGVDLEGIPQFLQSMGYKTAFHHNGSLDYDKQREFLRKYFQELVDQKDLPSSPRLGWGVPDEYLMRHSAQWLAEQKQPSFLTLFTITNHHPWVAPNGSIEGSVRERFLQTTRYTDSCLGLFVDLLREKKIHQNTVLFVLGDHGQPMGEHEENFHISRFLYEENVRVPLLILAEGRISLPQRIEALGAQSDLLATVKDLFGQPVHGYSLLRESNNRSIFLQNPYTEGYTGCRSGNWKWIQRGFSKTEELFDLSLDPDEKKNLFEANKEIAGVLRQETQQFFSSVDAFYFSRNKQKRVVLDFSNQLLFDEELLQVAIPEVASLTLAHCHLLTEKGIGAMLKQCPHLDTLNLSGLSHLTASLFQGGIYSHLKHLDLSAISDEGALQLAQSCPSLVRLCIEGTALTDRGFQVLGPNLMRFKIGGSSSITDEGMLAFLQKNPRINCLLLEGCHQLTDRFLSGLLHHPLNQLWVIRSPGITSQGIGQLKEHFPCARITLV